MKPGDLLGFEGTKGFDRFIRLGQRILHVKHWNVTHIGIVVELVGDGEVKIIQAVRRVNEVPIFGGTYVVIPFPGDDDRRQDVVRFARAALGRKYGVLSVLSRAVNCLTPKFIQIGLERSGDCDCSTLGARAWEHGGVILPVWDEYQVTPGQLCDWYIKGEAA